MRQRERDIKIVRERERECGRERKSERERESERERVREREKVRETETEKESVKKRGRMGIETILEGINNQLSIAHIHTCTTLYHTTSCHTEQHQVQKKKAFNSVTSSNENTNRSRTEGL